MRRDESGCVKWNTRLMAAICSPQDRGKYIHLHRTGVNTPPQDRGEYSFKKELL